MPLPRTNIFFGYEPTMTDEQREYVDSMIDNPVTIVNSVAGTGKTMLSVACAAYLQMKLYYIFSPTQEKCLGYRPGSQSEKEFEYTAPLRCALEALNFNPDQCVYSESRANDPRFCKTMAMQEKKGDIWVYPMSHVFARGTNIDNKFVIIDEAQNFTREELKKVITRIHDNCKLVIIGHTGQCDLDNKSNSGFGDYLEFYKTKDYAKICNLTKNFRGVISRDADTIDDFMKDKFKSSSLSKRVDYQSLLE